MGELLREFDEKIFIGLFILCLHTGLPAGARLLPSDGIQMDI